MIPTLWCATCCGSHGRRPSMPPARPAVALTLVNWPRERGASQAAAPIASTRFVTSEVVFEHDGQARAGRVGEGLRPGTRITTFGGRAAIVAQGTVIRDIGTRYEVRLSDQELRVRVRDGRVEVSSAFGMREADRGGQLRVTSSGILSGRAPTSGADWDWIVRATPPPQLEGRPLPEFLAWAEREGGRPIRFADPALERANAATIVYGAIEGLTVEEALDVVLPSCGLARLTDGNVITIVAADDGRGAK